MNALHEALQRWSLYLIVRGANMTEKNTTTNVVVGIIRVRLVSGNVERHVSDPFERHSGQRFVAGSPFYEA